MVILIKLSAIKNIFERLYDLFQLACLTMEILFSTQIWEAVFTIRNKITVIF